MSELAKCGVTDRPKMARFSKDLDRRFRQVSLDRKGLKYALTTVSICLKNIFGIRVLDNLLSISLTWGMTHQGVVMQQLQILRSNTYIAELRLNTKNEKKNKLIN